MLIFLHALVVAGLSVLAADFSTLIGDAGVGGWAGDGLSCGFDKVPGWNEREKGIAGNLLIKDGEQDGVGAGQGE